MKTRYVITGATGHVGNLIARHLLERKQDVRVVGRDRDRLRPLVELGAEPWVGNVDDRDFVKRVCEGAQAMFAMIPPFMAPGVRAFQNRVSDNYSAGVTSGGIEHVVTLSSIGANLDRGNGPVAGLHDLEQTLDRLSKVNLLHLRAGYFMENSLMLIPVIKQTGALSGAMSPTTKLSMIATADVADVAAKRLLARDFTGHQVLELQGAEDITFAQMTHAYGEAIGKPDLRYVQISYDDAKQGMLQMGMPEELADLYIEMQRAFNDGTIKPTQPRSVRTTTPTHVHGFARVFAREYGNT